MVQRCLCGHQSRVSAKSTMMEIWYSARTDGADGPLTNRASKNIIPVTKGEDGTKGEAVSGPDVRNGRQIRRPEKRRERKERKQREAGSEETRLCVQNVRVSVSCPCLLYIVAIVGIGCTWLVTVDCSKNTVKD